MFWHKLPSELHLMIFEMVADDFSRRVDGNARAGYAAVCREWQWFFERKNFTSLILDQHRISGLRSWVDSDSDAARDRRSALRHISLQIRLDGYDCHVCELPEDTKTVTRNGLVFTEAIWELFAILSRWPRSANGEVEQRIVLDLGVYSPSDSRHSFKDFRLQADYPIRDTEDLVDLRALPGRVWEMYRQQTDRLMKSEECHDPHHGWSHGHAVPPSLGARRRVTGEALRFGPIPRKFRPLRQLPKVPVIYRLETRRQSYRRISGRALQKICQACPNIWMFRDETWIPLTPAGKKEFLTDYKRLILGLPETVDALSLLGGPHRLLHVDTSDGVPRERDLISTSLANLLAIRSRPLKALSASYMVDAWDFFGPFMSPNPERIHNPWQHLRILTLTARCLNAFETSVAKMEQQLVAAGRAATVMPNLRFMELWTSDSYMFCIFRYSTVEEGTATISLESNLQLGTKFHSPLTPAVTSRWTQVATNAGRKLRTELKMTPWHPCYCIFLRLRACYGIVHPLTVLQDIDECCVNAALQLSQSVPCVAPRET